MSALLLGVCLALCLYAAVTLAAAMAVLATAPVVIRRSKRWDSASRARACLTLRLGPATLGLVVAGTLFLPAFLAGEPADTPERLGPGLWILAMTVFALVLMSVLRATREWWNTVMLRRAWLSDARPLAPLGAGLPAYVITSRFPLVAVVGIWRPVLVISDRVLASCTAPEMDAILAHEVAHLRARDNLIRLLFLVMPDGLSRTAVGRRLERVWAESSEEAADRSAGPERAPALARALVRVTRMAVGAPPPATIAALSRGGSIAGRIERLIALERGDAGADLLVAQRRMMAAAVVVWLALAVSPQVGSRIHAVAEAFVTWLQ